MFETMKNNALSRFRRPAAAHAVLCWILLLAAPGFTGIAPKSGAADWTAAQKEVWKTVEAYSEASHRRDLQAYLSFWHPDFLGWHNGDSAPTNRAQREQGLGYYFGSTNSLEYSLEPLGIQVVADGNAAIVHYKLRNILQSKKSGKKQRGISYWTDYLVKENGKWLLIGDHGGGVPDGTEPLLPFEWLIGEWQRLDVRPNQTAVETWTRSSAKQLAGAGVTMSGGDTTFVERLSLVARDGKVFYMADVAHNPEPTYFEMTDISENGFVCENPQHDFPKKIAYSLEGDLLTVVISGDGKEAGFRFRRKRE